MGTVTGGDAVTEEKEIDRLICIDDELSGNKILLQYKDISWTAEMFLNITII